MYLSLQSTGGIAHENTVGSRPAAREFTGDTDDGPSAPSLRSTLRPYQALLLAVDKNEKLGYGRRMVNRNCPVGRGSRDPPGFLGRYIGSKSL